MKHRLRPPTDPRARLHVAATQLAFGICLTVAGSWLAACDSSPAVVVPPAIGSPARHETDYGQLLVETDLRRHDAALAISFLRGDTDHRIAAARGLGLIGSEAALALLQRGLADPVPAVRGEVSFGLSLAGLPLDAWLGAYAVEPDERVRGLMTQDLGRALDIRRAGPLLRALAGPQARDACVGINHMLQRDPELPLEDVRALQRLASNADPTTVARCVRALASVGRASLAPVSAALLEQAAVGLRAAVGDVRLAWLKLLSTLASGGTSLLTAAADDVDPTVAAAAIAQLSLRGPGQLSTVSAAFEARLARVLAGRGTVGDASVLHAALDAVPALGRSAEVTLWLGNVVGRLAPSDGTDRKTGTGALHCAAARAFDRVREWPSRSIGCGGEGRPAWVGQLAAVEVISRAKGSHALRAVQLERLYDEGDWHVKRSVMAGLHGLPPELAQPLVLEGLSSDHIEVRTAATHAAALLLPRLHRTGNPSPTEVVAALRAAFHTFHVTQHVAGLRGWLAVVQGSRMRTELGGVTVLARSGIAAVREDARSLLAEWGHPIPSEPPEPVPDPVPRDSLPPSLRMLKLHVPTGVVGVALDPGYAPTTVARLIQWLGAAPPQLEVSDWRPVQYVVVSDATGETSTAWRSEESRASLLRGTVVVPQHSRDGVSAALLILLAPAPELTGRVAVVGQVSSEDLSLLDGLTLGDPVRAEVVAPR